MVTVIVTMEDNNTFGFNNYHFGIRSGFKKKTQNSSNSVKGNTFIKSEFITLRVEKIFSMNSIFEMYAKLGGQSRITYAVSYCVHICKIYEKYS